MSQNNQKVLEDLYNFCNEYNYQLQEEWQRIPKSSKQRMTFPAFCVAFYSTLNKTEEDERNDRDSLPMDSDEF